MADYEMSKGLLRGIAAGFRAKGNVHAAKTCDDAADAIEELLAAVPHWISVEERLPEKYESVITASKNGDVRWNYLINVKYGTWSNGYHITHWMPLPAPPKEEN